MQGLPLSVSSRKNGGVKYYFRNDLRLKRQTKLVLEKNIAAVLKFNGNSRDIYGWDVSSRTLYTT